MYQRAHETAAPATFKVTPAHRTEASEPDVTHPLHCAPRGRIAPSDAGVASTQMHAVALNQASGGQLARAGHALLQLQQQHGNRYVQQVVNHASRGGNSATAPVIQAKLALGPADDACEREADSVARQVVGQTGSQLLRAQQQGEHEHDVVVRRAPEIERVASVSDDALHAGVQQAVELARRGGQALPDHLRGSMEQAFGADFAGVRVHTDAQADQCSDSLQAQAFTTGRDIFFRRGAYEPGSRVGQELIAHELTHVVQQEGGAIASQIQRKVLAVDQFPGRRTDAYGVGEQLELSVEPQLLNQHSGQQFTWTQVQGRGALTNTNASQGEATYIAPSEADQVTLECAPIGMAGNAESVPILRENFSIIEPNAGRVEQQRGTKIWHKPGLWHVAFLANLYVLPDRVSFKAIKFQEGSATPQITGPWQAQRIDHAPGRDESIFPPDVSQGVNKVKTTDWVQSGTYQYDPGNPPGGASRFVWNIPWYYKLQGTTKEFTKIQHEAQDDGNGLARIRKDGSPWFEARVTDAPSWPFSARQDMESIEEMFPGQMNATEEQFLLQNEIERTEIIFADKEGHYPPGMTLQEALDIEVDIGTIFQYCPVLDGDTMGRIRKMPRDKRQKLVKQITSRVYQVATLSEMNKAIDAELGI